LLLRQSQCRDPAPPAGGGDKAIERQHEKAASPPASGSTALSTRARFFELGRWAAWNMYEEWGGAPARASSPASARRRPRA
jgi:3-methylcrotonyl-CoA carboxylase beta subunit